jgi:Right handed beta helix region
MTYTFKLARRLAQVRTVSVVAGALLSAACAGGDGLNDPVAPGSDPNSPVLTILPDSATVGTSDTVQFTVASLSTAAFSRSGKGKGHHKLRSTAMTVSPGTATLTSSAVQRFVATETMTDGTTSQPSVRWTATGGTIDSTGKYVAASTPGQYAVVAIASDGLADTATATVVANAPTVARVVLSPTSATVATGGSQQFTAAGKAGDGSTVGITPTYTATGGTITGSGTYTAAQTAGTFRVIAVDPATNLADTAVVTVAVNTPTVARVVLSPASATVTTGGSQQFTAVGKAGDGSTIAITPTYTATGGTITGSGTYTAAQTAGTFRVIARDPATNLADTAAVTVTAPAPTLQSIVLSPGNASLTTGAKQQFSVSAKMSDGTTKSISASYTATGGSIATSGEYTAGNTAGTYRVIAAESGGKADTAAVTITAVAPPPPPPSGSACSGALRTVAVSTTSALTSAIGSSQPGDCILLAAGIYATGTIKQTRGGTSGNPVTVRGAGASSVVTMGGGSWLPQAPYLRFENFRLTNTFYGFYCGESGAPGCPYAVFDSMEVDHAAQSGIALENGSSFSQVLRSKIHDTGTSRAVYGEGVYVGGYGTPTTDVKVLNNTFYNTGAEAIDNSAGADRMTATGNVIDGTGTAFIDGGTVSLVGLRGSNVVFSGNTLTKGSPHGIVVWSGSGTVLRGNTIHLFNVDNYAAPKGIDASRASGTQVGCDNVVTDIPSGGMAYTGTCTP